MIRTQGLTKRYGSVLAVDSLDLEVTAGDVYGFLGGNGSGKTTTVRMLLGLVLPTAGSVELLGASMPRSARSILPAVGALVEGPASYGHLSARANLRLLSGTGASRAHRSARIARIDDVLGIVGLADVGNKPVKAFSLGMRRRLGLALALLERPRLLVLDEPTNGLDPQGIHEIRELLLRLHAEGTTIFLSSHLLAEVEQLCSRIGVLDRGQLVLQEQLADLRRSTGRTVVRTPDVEAASRLLGRAVAEHRDGLLVVDDPDPAAVNARLVTAGIRVDELSPERRSLEQIVLAATAGAPR